MFAGLEAKSKTATEYFTTGKPAHKFETGSFIQPIASRGWTTRTSDEEMSDNQLISHLVVLLLLEQLEKEQILLFNLIVSGPWGLEDRLDGI